MRNTNKAVVREDLLHFIWKYKKFQLTDLYATNNDTVVIGKVGTHNHLSGPDFFNAQVTIDGQLWVGNVEIHIKSSDWYAHHHEEDPNYQNVILHVVWRDDAAIFRKDGSEIPALELQKYVSLEVLKAYEQLFDKRKKGFINCENHISETDDFVLQNWLERLYFERLEQKSSFVFELLKKSKNDWEHVLFSLLLKNFGLKINAEPFYSLANALDFSVLRKLQQSTLQLESVFLGMSHLLNDDTIVDSYFLQLKEEFSFLRHKFDMKESGVLKPDFFKLRPANFPTVRLSQLANLYSKHQRLFELVIQAENLEAIYAIFDVSASAYWKNHFTFGKLSNSTAKKLTKDFIDLLVINTILPLKFCYAKHMGREIDQEIIQVMTQVKAEGNSIIKNFDALGVRAKNAQDSQGLLQVYNTYCTKNRCLQCSIGSALLNRND